MKNIGIPFIMLAVLLSGCATYHYQHGNSPYDKGYVVLRDGRAIVEYTVGKDNSVPAKVALAKERFKRRKVVVENYYTKMGHIENELKAALWDPIVMISQLIGGVLRMPFIAISDYKYHHNPLYRSKVDKAEEEREAKEDARIKNLKEQLGDYIQKDLAYEEIKSTNIQERTTAMETQLKETSGEKAVALVKETQETPQTEQATRQQEQAKPEPAAANTQPAVAVEPQAPPKEPVAVSLQTTSQLKAVITAKPIKGFSPLTVHFYGDKSYSPHAKITAYSWEFGDGDISSKKNPVNTYYSGSFEPKHFIAALTVYDDKGNVSKADIDIEVFNK